MIDAPINHPAWLSVFRGLNELPAQDVSRVLGVSLLRAGRLKLESSEYVMNANRQLAEADYVKGEGRLRAKTLPKYLPKEVKDAVRED